MWFVGRLCIFLVIMFGFSLELKVICFSGVFSVIFMMLVLVVLLFLSFSLFRVGVVCNSVIFLLVMMFFLMVVLVL